MNWCDLYEIDYTQIVGKGAFNFVYPAKSKHDNKQKVCVKIIPKGFHYGVFEFEEREERELRIGGMLLGKQYQNIVQIFNCFSEGQEEVGYIFMERCENNILQLTFQKESKIQYCLIDNLIQQIANGYEELRQFKIIHRDLKPENILYNIEEGEIITFKIADFGLSKIKELNDDQATKNVGSPVYRAPEVEQQEKYDNRCDLYSLGVIIFQLLIGEEEFKKIKDTLTNEKDFLKEKPFSKRYPNYLTNIQQEYINLLDKLIAYDPKNRIGWNELFQWKKIVQNQQQQSNTEQLNIQCIEKSVQPSFLSSKPFNQVVQPKQEFQPNQVAQNVYIAQHNFVVQATQPNFAVQAPQPNFLLNQAVQQHKVTQPYQTNSFNQMAYSNQVNQFNQASQQNYQNTSQQVKKSLFRQQSSIEFNLKEQPPQNNLTNFVQSSQKNNQTNSFKNIQTNLDLNNNQMNNKPINFTNSVQNNQMNSFSNNQSNPFQNNQNKSFQNNQASFAQIYQMNAQQNNQANAFKNNQPNIQNQNTQGFLNLQQKK